MVLWQIYSQNYVPVPNFIKIAQVLWKISKKHFSLFFQTQYLSHNQEPWKTCKKSTHRHTNKPKL